MPEQVITCCICNEAVADWKRVGSTHRVVCVDCIEERLPVIEEPGIRAECEQCRRLFRVDCQVERRLPDPAICPECVEQQFQPFAAMLRHRQAQAEADAAAKIKADREQVQRDVDAEAERVRQAQDAADAAKWRAQEAAKTAKKQDAKKGKTA